MIIRFVIIHIIKTNNETITIRDEYNRKQTNPIIITNDIKVTWELNKPKLRQHV